MKNNFQQFANFGSPWITPEQYRDEERDAADFMCAPGRRRSARQFVEIRQRDQMQKSHNMRFSETKPQVEKSQSQCARVLSIRNRLASHAPEPAALADWQLQSRVFVSTKRDEADVATAKKPKVFHAYDRKFLAPFRRVLNQSLKAHIMFTYYTDIVREFGSVSEFSQG